MPNSRAVYILRMNRVQNKLEMVSIDAESGAAATIFQESDPYWINLDGDIEFLKDGKRFLWTSQRDGGFRHIFLSSLDGKSVTAADQGRLGSHRDQRGERRRSRRPHLLHFQRAQPTERHLYTMKLDGPASAS